MTDVAAHRLDGLEPDNLLAFVALLGLLRALEDSQPDWRARVFWTVDDPPLRPALQTPEGVDDDSIARAAAEGLGRLAQRHEFGGRRGLTLTPAETTASLRSAVGTGDRYVADLWAALASDAAVSRDGKKAEPTPLCLMFGQGHQHFLERLASVPQLKAPPDRGKGRTKITVSEKDCLRQALFAPWTRPDATPSFRWDPNEDVRYALRARDPTDARTKETTQHGANRLAAIGLSVLTVAPQSRNGRVRLAILGARRETDGQFVFRWPIWRAPISLASIRALLGHPRLGSPDTRGALGIVEVRRARRISTGKFMNVTRADPETTA